MKRSILMLLVMSAALIFFGCDKMEEVYPESEVAEEEVAAFKGAKAGNTFTGICTNVLTNSTASFTGVVETPVIWMGNHPCSAIPSVVMPTKGSSR